MRLILIGMMAFVTVSCMSQKNRQSDVLDGPQSAADDCLAGQDLNGADVNISTCAPIPNTPGSTQMALGNATESISLGAWEIYPGYKYGRLQDASGGGRELLDSEGGITAVDKANLDCWAKAYYRLRSILRDPPQEYVDLYKKGFQKRFFMFQSDKRKGSGAAWGGKITAYQDHLVKWNFTVAADGKCEQHTKTELAEFSKKRLAEIGN